MPTQKFLQGIVSNLYGSGIGLSNTSITLSYLRYKDGTEVVAADLGDINYATLDTGKNQEIISFTDDITKNANGTTTLNVVVRGLQPKSPYTADSSLRKPHSVGCRFVMSNNPQLYQDLASVENDETIGGKYTFPGGGDANAPVSGTVYTEPTDDLEYVSKKYADDLTIAGAPKATTSTYGLSKLSVAAVSPTDPIAVGDNDTRVPTQSENDALQGTSGIPSGTNRYVTNDDTTSTPTADAVVRGNGSGDIDLGWNPLSVSLPLYENINANELVKSINDNGTTKLQKVVGYGTQISKTTNGASTGQAQYGYFNNLFVYAYRNAVDDDLEGFAMTQSGNALTAGSLVELVAFAGSTVIPENVIVFSPTLYMVQTQNSGTTPDTQTFYVGTISGSTLSAPAVNTSYQDDDNISQVVRSSADKAVVTYSDGGVATYRIVNVTAAPTVSITSATVFTGGDTSTMINISDDRMILLSTSVGFDVYTVSSTLLTKVADNASVGTTGFRFFKTSDNNGVFGYSDGTDYFLRTLAESGGTITWSNTTKIITSDTAIDGLSSDGFGNYFVINGTNLFVYRIQGGSFVLQKTYTGFNGTITPFGYIGITGGLFVTSDPANTPVLMRSFYPDFQDTLGYINENGTAGQSKFLQRYGYKSGLSGLSTNVDYYVQNDATISGVSSAKILGKSISSTEIILDVSL